MSEIPDWLTIRKGDKVKMWPPHHNGRRDLNGFSVCEVIKDPEWGWDCFDYRTWVFTVRHPDGTIIHPVSLASIEKIEE